MIKKFKLVKLKDIKPSYVIISLLVAAAFGIMAWGAYGTGLYFPYEEIELSDISDVATDKESNYYVINDGGSEILRLNSSGEVTLCLKAAGSGQSTFERALDIAVDGSGNIFVHNRVASEDAVSWIGHENIVVYNRMGRFIGSYCNIDYDVPVLKPSIISIQNVEGEIFAFVSQDSGIMLENVINGDVSMYTYTGADKYVNAATYSAKEKCIYATTRNGKILKLKSDSFDICYATKENDTTMGCFEDIDIDDDGIIYVCDAKTGTVDKLENGQLESYFAPNYTVYDIDYNKNFIFNESFAVVWKSSGTYFSVSTTYQRGFLLFRSIIFLITQILIFPALVYPVYCVVYAILTSKSQKIKILAGLTVVVVILTSVFCLLVSQEFSSTISSNVTDKAIADGKLVNNLIDPADFKSLDSVTDYGSIAYNNIKDVVDNVILDDGTIPGDMYLIMYTLEEDGTVVERYTLEEQQGCNYPYIWTDGVGEAMIYETGITDVADDTSDAEGSFICIITPVTDEKENVIGLIEVGVDKKIFEKTVNEKVIHFAISIIAISVVLILLLLELIEFYETKKGFKRNAILDGTSMPPLKVYRVAVFAITFITNITTPFLSIYSLELSDSYKGFLGLSPEILAAIPISAEVLFGAIFSMLGGNIIEKLGSRKSAIVGSIMFTVGLVIRFIYPDLMVLTVGNSVQGAGWGIILLIINSRIAAEEDEKISEQGFTDYNIAMQNGINSGIVLGGFLLSFASYTSMLVIAALMSLIVLIFSYRYIFNGTNENINTNKDERTGLMAYVRFVLSPKVLVYFVCIVMPVIAASYYLNFLYPILGDQLGLSESFIGYSYLLNGLVIICLGNVIVNFMSKYFDKKWLLLIASLMYLVIFALVGLLDNIPALLISLILLAVADSFGYVAQSTFYTDLEETEKLGYEKAMGVYSLFENLSQAGGSFIFGYILTIGVKTGMTIYGLSIGVLGILFVVAVVFCERNKKRREGKVL